jgi:hypothetical protein
VTIDFYNFDIKLDNVCFSHNNCHFNSCSQVLPNLKHYVKVCADPAVTCAGSLNSQHGGEFENVNVLDLNNSVSLFDTKW